MGRCGVHFSYPSLVGHSDETMLILFPVLSASESEFLRQLADGLTAHGWKGTDFGQLPEKIVLPKSTISPGLVLPLAFYKDGRTILMAPSETDKAAVVLFTSLPSSPEGLWEGLMASVPGAISESGSG